MVLDKSDLGGFLMDGLTFEKEVIIDNDFILEQYKEARRINYQIHPSKSWKYGGAADEDFMYCFGEGVYKECKRFCNSRRARAKRCKETIKNIVMDGYAYFVTLTFNDETLKKTTFKTRRTLVSRALREVSEQYLANVDFGAQNGREHYHAIVCAPRKPKFESWLKSKRGFVQVKKIGSTESSLESVSRYVTKLSNHALKGSTEIEKGKAPRLIYSRGFRSTPPLWLFTD